MPSEVNILEEINHSNYHYIKKLSFFSTILMLFLIPLTILTNHPHYLSAYVGYLGFSLVLFLYLSIIPYQTFRPYILPVAYLFSFLSYIFSAYLGIFLTPHGHVVTFIALLPIFPLIIIDKASRIHIFSIITCIVFCITTYLINPPESSYTNIVNCLSFSALGILLGRTFRSVRLTNLNLQASLQKQNDTDALTSLCNRRKLFSTLEALKTSDMIPNIKGILMLDIDYFKKYNDYYGHQQGDLCLTNIAESFLKYSKKQDHQILFYRYGGEEFLAIVFERSPISLSDHCASILSSIEKLFISFPQNPTGFVTLSIGYAAYQTIIGDNFELLIEQADQALYQAKRCGRNRFMSYDTTEDTREDSF